jgi:hypothetical protein
MKPLSTVTSIVTRPPRAARSVAGLAASAAASGIRTSGRLVGWAAGRALGDRAVEQPAPVWTEATTAVTEEVVQPAETVDRVEPVEATPPPAPAEPDVQPTAKKAPARTSSARRAPAKRTPSAKLPPAKKVSAKKAPSAKAATAGPARAAAKKKSTNKAAAKKKSAAATPSPTDVTTPDPEPLLDSSAAKAIAKEAEVLQRAADPDKG